MNEETSYHGHCFCESVQFTLTGSPVAVGYCHCESCRHWSAGPVNAFTLWKPEALTITQGEDAIQTYHKTENTYRKWCSHCGGHVFAEHPGLELVDVFAGVLSDFPFKPEAHVNYQETVLHIHDGLPKYRDFPAEMGGSGEMVEE